MMRLENVSIRVAICVLVFAEICSGQVLVKTFRTPDQTACETPPIDFIDNDKLAIAVRGARPKRKRGLAEAAVNATRDSLNDGSELRGNLGRVYVWRKQLIE